jgi:hypothetical protein
LSAPPWVAQVLVSDGQAWPPGQQTNPSGLFSVLHVVKPASQPQTVPPDADRTQATPALQQKRPQGVVPLGQHASHSPPLYAQMSPVFGQQCEPHATRPAGQPHLFVLGSTHATPAGQQLVPHGVVPDPQATVPLARNGFRTVAAAAPAMATPAIFNAPRREVPLARVRDKSSKRSLIHPAYSQEVLRRKGNFLVSGPGRYPDQRSWVR